MTRSISIAALTVLLAALGCGCSYLPGHAGSAKAATLVPVRFIKLQSTVLNLADLSGGAYLRIGVSLALRSKVNDTDDATQTIARDLVVTIASAKSSDQLMTPAGKAEFKRELLAALQKRLPQAQLTNIYFDEFLVQH